MIKKNDVVYYKVKLQKLFQEAKSNGIEIELGLKEIAFTDKGTTERAVVKLP
ncbi:hypothetical protein [Bacteroides sp.]|uniref:hypothetical protein n=1 Tax=Bacteroides sp. TaxID=29523 RepID=UPI002619DAC6|nr:hypothetical protein [Bacteroides sp.]MDD3040414.1 hypothetical protein [Bacteroides sp.]